MRSNGGGAVVMVAVDASKEMADYTVEWAIRNVVRLKDTLILAALVKPTSSSGKMQSQAVGSDRSKLFGSLRKKLSRLKDSIMDKDSEHPRQSTGFENEGMKWIYEVCLELLSDLCCENDVEQVKAQVMVVPCADIGSVANLAEKHRADWVILDRRLKKESECCMQRLNCNIITVKNAIPKFVKIVNEEEKEDEFEKAGLLALLTLTDESSSATSTSVTTSLKSSASNMSRSSASSSDQEGGGAAHPVVSAHVSAPWQPELSRSPTSNQQRSYSPLPLPPGRRPADNVSRFNISKPEGISRGRLSVDSATNPRNETKPTTLSFDHNDKDTVFMKIQQGTNTQDSSPIDTDNTMDDTETEPTTEQRGFKDESKSVETEQNTALSTTALPTTLSRSSSIRSAMSISTRQQRAPPPLCSVCRHNAPVFGKPPRKFSYKEMETATDGFSRKNFLAEGGFGPVYRGVLDDGQVVAVKKRKEASAQGAAEFCSEVEVLSCAQHKNLVMLVGYCSDKNEWMLVYEFACNGSLDKHLHVKDKAVMAWKHRQKVAIGAARGLRYLHEDCRVGCIVHRDLRPNNILLTHDFEAMVGDFGLARWQMDGQAAEETRIVGTLGYLAPEYTQTGQITEKADVYSLGVLMMELITGVKAIELVRRGMLLRHWTPLVDRTDLQKLIDPQLEGRYDEQEVERMMRIAGLCVSQDPETRPRMSKVLRLLEGDMESDSVAHPRTQQRSSISECTNNVSHRLSKILNPISRSTSVAPYSRSLTPPTLRYSYGSETDRRSKTPPPARFGDNMPKLSDNASHQQYQIPTTSIYRDSKSHLRSQLPSLMSRSKINISTGVKTSSHIQEFEFPSDTYEIHAEEELRSNNILKPTSWKQTDNDAFQEMEDVGNRGIFDQDDLNSREYHAYLQDSFFQFIQNTKRNKF